jgi:hypothetical protein
MVLSEVVERLMMMSGSDASTFPAECGQAAASRLTEVVAPPSQRDIAGSGGPSRELSNCRSDRLWLAPLERGAIYPDTMEDHCDLSGDGNLRLLHPDPLCEFHSPGLEG